MKRPSVQEIKDKLKRYGIQTDVFLSDRKTILVEPKDNVKSKRLWDKMHRDGYLLVPDGNEYYSVKRKEN